MGHMPSSSSSVLISLLNFYIVLTRILQSYHPLELDLLSYVSNSGGYGEYELLAHELLRTDPAP
jgi:hypothetical protein